MDDTLSMILNCPSCSWLEVYDQDAMCMRLRQEGMLRREHAPDVLTLRELFHDAARRMQCPKCSVLGLSARISTQSDDGDWQDAVRCEVCRRPIPPERLEAIPTAARCVICQASEEAGIEAAPEDFCSKCGAPMVLRVQGGDQLTRYRLFCTGNPPCRRNYLS